MTSDTQHKLVDTHAHLSDEAFASDMDEVINRAYAAGISTIITIAETEHIWQHNCTIADSHSMIYAALGVHPHDADHYASRDTRKALSDSIKKHASHKKVIAVGETGLDYYKKYADPVNQKKLLLTHLEAAQECSLPVVIHCRQAYPEVIRMLRDVIPSAVQDKKQGVVHCFSGTLEEAEQLCSMGFLLGIDGPVTYPKSDVLRNIVKNIPLSNLLLETDSPYLAPQCFRGKRNEPSYLSHIAADVAKIKKIPFESVCTATSANALKIFRLGNPAP